MRRYSLLLVLLLLAATCPATLQAQAPAKAPERIELPKPSRSGGMTLAETLATRRSNRSLAPTRLTPQEMAQLLWAAQGITDDRGHRTAPSARAQYFLHLFVATPEGFFEYLPAAHALQKLSDKDLRAGLSTQKTVTDAPAVFLITGETQRATQGNSETGLRWVHLEAGHAAQNLLLQATALGLGAVPVGGIQPQQIQQVVSLPANQAAVYLIPVGHPR